jgi:5-methyltetrahydropteroyltriglutamate--homocysteine methyltransferase
MRLEYETIAGAGVTLQVDCPDLAMGRHTQFRVLDLAGFRDRMELNVEALNRALVNIPATQVRMHLCWGNYPGPHHFDVPLQDIVDIVWKAKPHAIQFEAANPRHGHEWTVFETVKVPDGKVLIPGVIECQSNYIEHPELVAQRIGRYAKLAGRDNVMAGVDCGFSIHVGSGGVDPDVVWAKLGSLAQGAAIASRRFWS